MAEQHKIITSLTSDKVYVFPAGLRGSNYNKSKFTTEDNLILFSKLSANYKNSVHILTPFLKKVKHLFEIYIDTNKCLRYNLNS